MLASLPWWVKMVWIAVRSFQGRGEACYAKYEMIGERALNESGKPMDKGQVSRAISTLIEAGFLQRITGRSVRCIDPVKVDEGSTFDAENDLPKVDHPSTKVDHPSTKVDEGSTPSKNQHRKPTLKTKKSTRQVEFADDSWQMVFASTSFDRLQALGKLPSSLARHREKTVEGFADVFDKLHRIDGHTTDTIKAVMGWLLRSDCWWIKNNNFRSVAKLRDKHKDGSTYFEIINGQRDADKNRQHEARDNAYNPSAAYDRIYRIATEALATGPGGMG